MFYVRSNDGTRIAVYECNKGCPKTVFLVHGWPLSHKIYEYQIELLTRCGYHVVAVDLRGFGESDTPACGYGYDQMAADIYHVVKSMGLKKFILTGFSMGGAIVLRYMRLFCGYGVEKLILLAAAAPSWTQREGYPYGLTRKYVDSLICLAETDRPQLACNFSHEQLFAAPHREPVKQWFRDIALSASGLGTVRSAMALRDEDGRCDLPCVHVPTWIIHGGKDVAVSNDLARIQKEGIPCSRLVTLENSGHGIMYDELALFNRIFLRAVRTNPQER